MSFHFHDLIDHYHRRLTGRGTATDLKSAIEREEIEERNRVLGLNRDYDEYTDFTEMMKAIHKGDDDEAEKLKDELDALEIIKNNEILETRELERIKGLQSNLQGFHNRPEGRKLKELKEREKIITDRLDELKKGLSYHEQYKLSDKPNVYSKKGMIREAMDDPEYAKLKEIEESHLVRGDVMEERLLKNPKILKYTTGEEGIISSKDKNNPNWSKEFKKVLDTKDLSMFPIDGIGHKKACEIKTLTESFKTMSNKKGAEADKGIHIGGIKFGLNVIYNPVFTKDKKTGNIKYSLYIPSDRDIEEHKKNQDKYEEGKIKWNKKNPNPKKGEYYNGTIPPLKYSMSVFEENNKDLVLLVSLEDGKFYLNTAEHPELWIEDTIVVDAEDEDGIVITDADGKTMTKEIGSGEYVLNFYNKYNNPSGTVGQKETDKGRVPVFNHKYWKKVPKYYDDKNF